MRKRMESEPERTFSVDNGQTVRRDVKVAKSVDRGDVRQWRNNEVLTGNERLAEEHMKGAAYCRNHNGIVPACRASTRMPGLCGAR